ncbi:hypothetical protein [Streptomyces sp. RB17]|uniref:hypothetical protein n=1 Tax=Streptomyces sp. RB17 TaxID=2585197 RepID=UPI001295A4D0|nr:hypothetical protein [Streptomyces sp. RB17]
MSPKAMSQAPSRCDENVFQSRLTFSISSARVMDQKPGSFGIPAIPGDQCTGHFERSSAKSACGAPSFHRSMSATVRSSSGRSVEAIGISLGS